MNLSTTCSSGAAPRSATGNQFGCAGAAFAEAALDGGGAASCSGSGDNFGGAEAAFAAASLDVGGGISESDGSGQSEGHRNIGVAAGGPSPGSINLLKAD